MPTEERRKFDGACKFNFIHRARFRALYLYDRASTLGCCAPISTIPLPREIRWKDAETSGVERRCNFLIRKARTTQWRIPFRSRGRISLERIDIALRRPAFASSARRRRWILIGFETSSSSRVQLSNRRRYASKLARAIKVIVPRTA